MREAAVCRAGLASHGASGHRRHGVEHRVRTVRSHAGSRGVRGRCRTVSNHTRMRTRVLRTASRSARWYTIPNPPRTGTRDGIVYAYNCANKLCKRAPHKPRIRCYRQLPCHPPLEDSTCEFGAELTPSCSILSRLKRGGSVNASYRHEDTDSRISVAPSPLTPHSVHIHANSPHRPQKTDPAPNASKMNRVTSQK